MSKPRITPIVMPDATTSKPDTNELSEEKRSGVRQTASGVWAAFSWGDTAEGNAFWNSVYARLIAISNGEPLK